MNTCRHVYAEITSKGTRVDPRMRKSVASGHVSSAHRGRPGSVAGEVHCPRDTHGAHRLHGDGSIPTTERRPYTEGETEGERERGERERGERGRGGEREKERGSESQSVRESQRERGRGGRTFDLERQHCLCGGAALGPCAGGGSAEH